MKKAIKKQVKRVLLLSKSELSAKMFKLMLGSYDRPVQFESSSRIDEKQIKQSDFHLIMIDANMIADAPLDAIAAKLAGYKRSMVLIRSSGADRVKQAVELGMREVVKPMLVDDWYKLLDDEL